MSKHVKCFDSDQVHSLGWMIEVLPFIGKKLYSQLPSPSGRIDKNQPFTLQRLTSIQLLRANVYPFHAQG